MIRVWCAGCSTGEEAYSLAILLQEHMEAIKQSHSVQLFATDIDSRAIVSARAGVYPASIATSLTPERLARFFATSPDDNAYRVSKGIRDMLVFSEQDVLKDPPFSKLDLISCRNLLIYLGAELQKKLIPLFHYALKPNGMLFLGTSEGVGEFDDLFAALDRKSKLYLRAEGHRNVQRAGPASFLAPVTAIASTVPGAAVKHPSSKQPLRELTEQTLLRQVAPACALVNGQGDLLYLHGRTGRYLEPTPGDVGINNILKMAREGLRRDLTSALHQVVRSAEIVRCRGLRVKTNGDFTLVNLTVCPVTTDAVGSPEAALYLVILEDAPAVDVEPAPTGVVPARTTGLATDADAAFLALKEELRTKEEYLRSTHEELETTTEELKSSNEEMQSVNEELQSTNEELETSKEELQSVNEELATVNTELQTKVADLSRTNTDMNNLLSGTGIATIFVDLYQHVLRFTPTASVVINLIGSDIGRPLHHIASNLVGYDRLETDLQSVLDTLAFNVTEVQTKDGRWFKMHIRPYRTIENVIEGAVITFVDISDMVQMREELRKANDQLLRAAVVVRDASDAITVQELDGRIIAWNTGAARMYGWTESEALELNALDRIPEALRADELTKVQQLSRAEILAPYQTQRLTKRGSVVKIWMTATALINEERQMYAIATTERVSGPWPADFASGTA